MQKVRLIYVSVMTEECDTEALQDILCTSQKNNQECGISGVLCYDPAFFMQVLEGPRDTVNEVYARIAADTRHKSLTLLEYTEIEKPLFGDWTMAFLRPDILDEETRGKFSHQGKLNPFLLNADQARDFLLALVEARRRLV
ncbi:MAG TPA: BLUF domain-containing protein [Candidatus Hydrogenedentes bacterium]|jgi:hypothetical protein|nr:BLUF domain-containing protein [Candidatus Hydrogenedentota bacterium]HQN01817.1 BLUF domain-containing protein [Candidatus Hydrogenedentota bacterium]